MLMTKENLITFLENKSLFNFNCTTAEMCQKRSCGETKQYFASCCEYNFFKKTTCLCPMYPGTRGKVCV